MQDEALWSLEVEHGYTASHLKGGQRTLIQEFVGGWARADIMDEVRAAQASIPAITVEQRVLIG